MIRGMPWLQRPAPRRCVDSGSCPAIDGCLDSAFLYFPLPHARPVPVKSWSCTSWFGQWSPDPPSSATAGLPVLDRWRVTWRPPVSRTAGSGDPRRTKRRTAGSGDPRRTKQIRNDMSAHRASQVEHARVGSLHRCSCDHHVRSGARFGSENSASQPDVVSKKLEKPASFSGIFLELGDRPWLDSRRLE